MRRLLILCFSLLQFATLQAQNLDYQHVLTVNTGASFVGLIFNVLDDSDFSETSVDANVDGVEILGGFFESGTTPALQFNYDYGVAKWFSIGGGIAYQRFSADISDLFYNRESDGQRVNIESASIDINRINIGIRALFHYGNTDKIDMYSGFRVGITNWGTAAEASDPSFEEDLEGSSLIGVLPAVQVIPFALRGYVTENLGLNFETGLGTPHYFAVGLNYRL